MPRPVGQWCMWPVCHLDQPPLQPPFPKHFFSREEFSDLPQVPDWNQNCVAGRSGSAAFFRGIQWFLCVFFSGWSVDSIVFFFSGVSIASIVFFLVYPLITLCFSGWSADSAGAKRLQCWSCLAGDAASTIYLFAKSLVSDKTIPWMNISYC